MKVIVTGASGFIGKRLVSKLNQVWEVVEVEQNDCWFFLEHFTEWDDVECIFHMGAISDTTASDPIKINYFNVTFTLDLFKIAIAKGIPVKYASSASVYGMTQTIMNPLNFYAQTKLMVDTWVEQNIKDFNHIQGFRFYNVYGPGEEDKVERGQASPVSTFAKQAKETGKIKLFEGSAQFFRDFIHVDDVIEVMLDNDKGSGIYDLGTSKTTSFEEVGECVADRYNAEIEYIPFPAHLKGKYQEFTKAQDEGWKIDFIELQDYVQNSLG